MGTCHFQVAAQQNPLTDRSEICTVNYVDEATKLAKSFKMATIGWLGAAAHI
jgi:hypothetical protein